MKNANNQVENSQLADYFSLATKMAMGLAALIHVGLVLFFYILDIQEVAIYNAFSAVYFFILYFALRRNEQWVNVIFFLACFEILLHASVVTYYLGLDSGFHFFIWIIVPIMALNQKFNRWTLSILFTAVAFVQGAFFEFSIFKNPSYTLEPWLSNTTYFIAIITVFSATLIIVYYYRTLVVDQTARIEKEAALLEKLNQMLEKANKDISIKNKELEQFSSIVSHDIKSPLNNISELVKMIRENDENLDEKNQNMLNMIDSSADKLSKFVSDLFLYSQVGGKRELIKINVEQLVKELLVERQVTDDVDFKCIDEIKKTIMADEFVLRLVFRNLIDNAIKYNDKAKPIITVRFFEDTENYFFEVKDNGPGISEAARKTIFELWKTGGKVDRYGNTGSGFGLAVIKKTLESIDANIHCLPNSNEGVTFCFNLPKTVSK